VNHRGLRALAPKPSRVSPCEGAENAKRRQRLRDEMPAHRANGHDGPGDQYPPDLLCKQEVVGSIPIRSTDPDTARTSWTSGYGSCRDGRGRRGHSGSNLAPTFRHLLPTPLREGIASLASIRGCTGKELLLEGASHPGLIAVW
jgi:hypothetical protein